MTRYGLALSCEELGPTDLVRAACAAEAAGFDFISISDHYHPWLSVQGHSPFVWSILGAIAQATEEIHVGVGVTCPIMRIHPAVIAQAVATTACLLGDRFTWGVGTGEALNEHILGDRWPPAPVRLDMLTEAIDVVRQLLTGRSITFYGEHFTVEDARIFDLPDELPLIVMSAFGPLAATRAAQIADGLWVTGSEGEQVTQFHEAGGSGPVWSQLSLCWGRDHDVAIARALHQWPNTLVPGQLSQDLRTIHHFEQATNDVSSEQIARQLHCGPDLDPIIDSVRAAIDAGIDHVYFHQIGNPMDGFVELFRDELRPELP